MAPLLLRLQRLRPALPSRTPQVMLPAHRPRPVLTLSSWACCIVGLIEPEICSEWFPVLLQDPEARMWGLQSDDNLR